MTAEITDARMYDAAFWPGSSLAFTAAAPAGAVVGTRYVAEFIALDRLSAHVDDRFAITGASQRQVAAKAGVTQSYISRLCTGQKETGPVHASKVYCALGVQAFYLAFRPAKTPDAGYILSLADGYGPVVGTQLRTLRRTAGERGRLLTLVQLAMRLEVSKDAVVQFEAGKTDQRTNTIRRYFAGVGTDVLYCALSGDILPPRPTR